MKKQLRTKLISIARQRLSQHDPSHDFSHALRVLKLAEYITEEEKADFDITIPAALFHDVVKYQDNDPKAKYSTIESANTVGEILKNLPFPQSKITLVQKTIRICRYESKRASFLEGRIVQDADWLEATGAIAIMRTFSSTGTMNRPFYNIKDPFCEKRRPEELKYALDFFFTRLLNIRKRVSTETAKEISKKRTKFLKIFLERAKEELQLKS